MKTKKRINEKAQSVRAGLVPRGERGQSGKRVGGLVVLNLALLGVLGAVSFSPMADAQSAKSANGTTRARGEYSIVGGATIGGVSSVIYVLDTINRELIALNWNDSTKSLEGVGYRDLSLDAKSDPDR